MAAVGPIGAIDFAAYGPAPMSNIASTRRWVGASGASVIAADNT
jgi:hypothetical protein